MNQHTSPWAGDTTAFLVSNYPVKGRDWCAREMGMTTAQIRQKASRLGLKARGVSEAWQQKQRDHAQKLTGRKRPDQALVMKRLHEAGKLKKNEAQRAAMGARQKKWIAEHGHPRGALGMKHSDGTKERIAMKSRAAWERMTTKMKIERNNKWLQTRIKNGTKPFPRKGTTWKSGWRVVGGLKIFFRSRWEANYARYLEWLRTHGQIAKWEHEAETFWFKGIQRGTLSYLPDFRITNPGGTVEYHEVKGWMDSRSKTQIKRMKKYHPSVILRVVESRAYRSIRRTISKAIPEWE